MKGKKLAGITLMLATAVVSTAVGGALVAKNAVADTTVTATTESLSNIFAAANTAIKVSEDNAKESLFVMQDDGSVTLKRDLALKWHTADKQKKDGEAEYFSFKFKLGDTNFEKLTISMDAVSAWATKDDLANNTLSFEKNSSDEISLKINGEEIGKSFDKADAGEVITVQFADGETDGAFKVLYAVGDDEIKPLGLFENIGANYAKYSNSSDDESYPLKITAELPAQKEGDEVPTTTVAIVEINGQSFTGVSEDKKVTDNAAPVLIVNEDIDGFLLGTTFSLDYKVIDVVKSKNLDTGWQFYQWTPAKDGEPAYKADDEDNDDYKKLTASSTYFMDTVYYVDGSGNVVKPDAEGNLDTDGKTAKSVFTTTGKSYGNGKEYVSILVRVGDDTFKKQKIDLSWYANDTAVENPESSTTAYIVINKNEDGAKYAEKYVYNIDVDVDPDVEKYETRLDEELFKGYREANAGEEVDFTEDGVDYVITDVAAKSFHEQLAAAAEKVSAGSNSYIYFPSFDWLIKDNNGYRNLKFTISYKTPDSDSPSTSSSLSYNKLQLAVTKEGKYEFKIFANDKAGNAMKYADENGKLVSVTSSNVWGIDGIPAFSFEIANKPLEVEEPSNVAEKKDTEILDKTYTLDEITVVGATNLKEDYALYRVDLSGSGLAQSALYNVSYTDLADKVKDKLASVTDGDYFTLYLNAYAELLAENLGGNAKAEDIVKCFTLIKEYDSRINKDNQINGEWDAYNKYNWSPSSKSFKTAEEGAYLILADYSETDIWSQRAAAYKVVVVESEADVIKGETQWLKNNVVSVVLFSIAGVMLILIIILLLVKPSDETLEDVDAQAAKVSKKSVKKEKTVKKNK